MRIRNELDRRLTKTLRDVTGEEFPAIVRPAKDPQFGDFQANGIMGAAKRLKTNPRELAQKVVAAAQLQDLCAEPEIAGPGFVNLNLTTEFLGRAVTAMAADARVGVEPVEQPRTIVVDFSSPNVAKPLHVGHLRSTILGDAVVRVLTFLGHKVVGDNHVGDWGTQFGMLIYGFRRWGDDAALAAQPTDELERVYKLTNAAGRDDESVGEAARAELAKLQAGDADNLAVWQHFIGESRKEVERIYEQLL